MLQGEVETTQLWEQPSSLQPGLHAWGPTGLWNNQVVP